DIRDHKEPGEACFDGADCTADEVIVTIGFFSKLGFGLGTDDGEERHRGDSKLDDLFELFEKEVDTETLDTRHGVDRLTRLFTFEDENGIDQVARREGAFGNKLTERGKAAETARPQKRMS